MIVLTFENYVGHIFGFTLGNSFPGSGPIPCFVGAYTLGLFGVKESRSGLRRDVFDVTVLSAERCLDVRVWSAKRRFRCHGLVRKEVCRRHGLVREEAFSVSQSGPLRGV